MSEQENETSKLHSIKLVVSLDLENLPQPFDYLSCEATLLIGCYLLPLFTDKLSSVHEFDQVPNDDGIEDIAVTIIFRTYNPTGDTRKILKHLQSKDVSEHLKLLNFEVVEIPQKEE